MTLTIEKRNDTAVVRPRGSLTGDNADQLRRELCALADWGQVDILVELDQVDSIDSYGLAVFVICYQGLQQKDRQLTVVSDNPHFQKLFALVRLDRRFTVCNSQRL